MAMAVTYAVQDGMILWETRSGVTTVYVPDHNGNVIECRDNSGNQTYSCEYWPYGEVQTSTGTNPGKFGFGGIVGYVTDLATRLYVRARHYAPARASWLTVDPLWPRYDAYSYVGHSPLRWSDPSGLMIINLLLKVATDIICSDLSRQIAGTKEEIVKRFWDMYHDKNDLYRFSPNPNPNRPWDPTTWPGHQQQYRDQQTRLRNLLNKYNTNGCNNRPPFNILPKSCWNWSAKRAPSAPGKYPFLVYPGLPIGTPRFIPLPTPFPGSEASEEIGEEIGEELIAL